MGRRATGSVYTSGGRKYARIRLAGQRESFHLPTCITDAQAEKRKDLLVALEGKLRRLEHVTVDVARGLLERAASREGQALEDVKQAVEVLRRGEAKEERRAASRTGPSVKELGERWTSGELAREYPDHVRAKRSVSNDVHRFERYVYPVVGAVLISDFRLEHAQAVMRGVPEERSAATRRHVAQLLHRLLGIAVFPLSLIDANPLPKGFLPKVGPSKAKGWLYPDEDARLMASSAVPLCWRVFYGFLHREGPRLTEAARLTLADVDLEHGVVALDENKTDDPRAWALSPGVVRALSAWLKLRGATGDNALVFVGGDGEPIRQARGLADQYREHLRAAGIERAALFEESRARLKIRLHDTRGTFVTLSLANGKTETWVQDRTGHKSTLMINKYRRASRTAAELRLGELAPLDQAIHEFREPPRSTDTTSGATSDGGDQTHPGGSGPLGGGPSARIATDGDAAGAFKIRGPQGRPGSNPGGATTAESLAKSAGSGGVDASCAGQNAGDSSGPAGSEAGDDGAPPRAAVLAHLGEALRLATSTGDVEAARSVHEAIGRLLGAPVDASAAPVVDLAAERSKRGSR